MTFDKNRSAGYVTNRLARLFAHALQAQIKPFGLAPAQFMTLLELHAEDGLTQKQLVERLDVEQATVANTLARMERDGLVVRRANPDDERSRLVWLTDRARDVYGPATSAAGAINAEALAGLTPEEREMFLSLMLRVTDTLKSAKP